jgi:hypothetical protein
MPTTKLTLTVKPEVVKMAKQYARRHNTSVSATFSRVICALVGKEQDQAMAVPAGSALEKLSGIITLPEGKTADDVLFEALVEKYGLEESPRRGH